MTGSVLTLEECARELKVTINDVLYLIENEELKAKKIANTYRITMQSFNQYLNIETNNDNSLLIEIKKDIQLLLNKKTSKKMLLSDVLNEVIELKSMSVSSNTLEWNRDISKHIHRLLGDRFVDELTPKDIQLFYNKVSLINDKRISNRLMQGIKGLLGSVFKYAKENNFIDETPITSSLYLPKTLNSNPHDRFMDYDQICRLLQILENSKTYSTMTLLLVMSGLRIGEALSLQWQDIDFYKNVIRVRNSLVREYYYENGKKKSKYVIGPTKTAQSIRDIPVSSQVTELLKCWKEYVINNEKWTHLIELNKSENLVFPNKHGLLQNEHTFRTNFNSYIDRYSGSYLNVTFHRLRHSYGSFLLEQGEELITVSRLLGHKNIRVTADIYCVVTNRLKNRAAEKTKIIWDRINN